jgi:hypothetical protein
MKRGFVFWFLIVFFGINIIMLLMAQVGIFNYDLAVSLGQHDKEEWIGETGVAIALGFNLGDILQEVFCLLAIIGLFRRKLYGWVASICELAISIYWPITFIGYYFFASKTASFQMPNSVVKTHIIFMVIWIIIGIICIPYLIKYRQKFVDKFLP